MDKIEEENRLREERMRPPDKISYLTKDFQPNKKTRSEKLREESIRRMINNREIELRREKLNEEMRKQSVEEAAKRLADVPTRVRVVDNFDKKKRDKKQKMRDDYEAYMSLLKASQDGIKLKGTLLERVENELLQIESRRK